MRAAERQSASSTCVSCWDRLGRLQPTSLVVREDSLTVFGFLEIVAAISIVLPLVLGGYVLLAARARRMFKSARAVRTINRSTGAAMACAAVAVATR